MDNPIAQARRIAVLAASPDPAVRQDAEILRTVNAVLARVERMEQSVRRFSGIPERGVFFYTKDAMDSAMAMAEQILIDDFDLLGPGSPVDDMIPILEDVKVRLRDALDGGNSLSSTLLRGIVGEAIREHRRHNK